MKIKNFFGVMVLTAILTMFTILSLTGCGADSSGGGNGGGKFVIAGCNFDIVGKMVCLTVN